MKLPCDTPVLQFSAVFISRSFHQQLSWSA